MTAAEIKAEADKLSKEAKDTLNKVLLSIMKIPNSDNSIRFEEADRIVECIISASILSITLAQAQAMEEMRREQS